MSGNRQKGTGDNLAVIVTNQENPEPLELIADSIIEIAEAFKKIQKSKLSQRVILLLLNDQTGLPLKEIKLILDTVPKLGDNYIVK